MQEIKKKLFDIVVVFSISSVLFEVFLNFSVAKMFSDMFPNQTFFDNVLRDSPIILIYTIFILTSCFRLEKTLISVALLTLPWTSFHLFDRIAQIKDPFILEMTGLFAGISGISTFIVFIAILLLAINTFWSAWKKLQGDRSYY